MLKKVRNTVVVIFLIIFIGVGITSFYLLKSASDALPNVEKLVEEYEPIVPTIIYDANGEIIDRLYVENRDIAAFTEIPDTVKEAFLAIEDRRFYDHNGFDYLRLTKSIVMAPIYMFQNKNVPGGSTITQQLAKNAFLTFDKRIMRKVKEAIITIEIERKYTKEEILEKYINEIPYGNGTHGIKSAARLYFNKSLDDLNLAESAFLAGLPQAPSWFNPYRHFQRAKNKQELVLRQMYRFNFIDEQTYYSEKDRTITIAERSRPNYRAPAFTDIVTSRLFDMFDEDLVRRSGLKIYTTLDLRMQRAAERAFNNSKHLQEFPDLQGSLITIDSKNGEVKSVIGGRDFITGNFNRAIMSKRLPGSAFKHLVYYTALENGYQMNTIIEDTEKSYGNWTPQNYSSRFDGNRTMLKAMESSINTVAVKILEKSTVRDLIQNARKAGIKAEIPYNLTVALGTIALSPYELATSYIPFSNGGYSIEPVFIKRVEDIYGQIIYETNPKKEKVFDTKFVSLLLHMLRNVVLNGSGKNANVGIEQAGKTGTTNNFTNAWYSGFTSDMVTTLYIGYDDNRPMREGMAGGGVAAPIWGDYYRMMLEEGIYIPGEFQFLDNFIEDKELIYKEIDHNTGLLVEKKNYFSRKALFERGKAPIEFADKYAKGLEVLLTMDENADNNKESEEYIQ